MVDRWVPAACAALVATLATVLAGAGDSIGIDTLRYVAAAKSPTAPSELPPGLPLVLAPFADSVFAMRILMLLVTAGLVACIWWSAVKVGGWRSGAAASVLMLVSPAVVADGGLIMSDRLGALLVVGGLVALLHQRPVIAGVLIGLSGWVRLVHVAFAGAVPRRAWLSCGLVLAALAGWQIGIRGSLFGYAGSQSFFKLSHIAGGSSLEVASPYTNIGYFPIHMFGLEPFAVGGRGAYFVPLLVFPGAIGLLRHWNRTSAFAAGVILVNLLIYLPYYYQSPRFMLPGGCLLLVYAAAAVGEVSNGAPPGDLADDPSPGERRIST